MNNYAILKLCDLNVMSLLNDRCQAKNLTCEISDFTPCTHAQSNTLHTKYFDKTDYQGLGIRVQVSMSGQGMGYGEKKKNN